MRFIIIYFYFLSIASTAIAQNTTEKEAFLQRLENAQIVLLGEPDHYSTPEMLKKVELITYLHDSLGYNWLAFESSLYDMHKANQAYLQGMDIRKVLHSGIFGIWHRDEAIDSLENYLRSIENRQSLQLMGFDSQINSGTYTEILFCKELQSFLKDEDILVPNHFFEKLQKQIEAFDAEKYTISPDFDPAFLDDLNTVIEQLKASPTPMKDFWRQNLIAIHGLFYDHYFNQVGIKVNTNIFQTVDYNHRDSLMAQNMLWFLKNHPNEKIIGWGATFHFANDVSTLNIPYDTTFSSARPMGYHLKKALGDKVVAIGFTDLQRIKDAKGSFCEDKKLYQEELSVIDFDELEGKEFHSSLIGFGRNDTFPAGTWSGVLDYGIAFDSEAPFKREGYILNMSDGSPIPFAHIKVSGANIGTITNENGKFKLLLPLAFEDANIYISSVGFQPITLPQSSLKGTIKLQPNVGFLEMVEVTAEREMPIDLLKKVTNQFVEDSKTKDYQLEMYYYSWWTDVNHPNDTSVNEAALKMIYQNGYTKDQKLSHTILNKRQVHGKDYLIPWPVYTIGIGDFRPDVELLNPKISKFLMIDSIKHTLSDTDTLTTFFYSISRLSPKLIGSAATNYRATITFSSTSLKVKRRSVFMGFNEKGIQEIACHIDYQDIDGIQVPSFAWLEYKGQIDGKMCIGKEALRITNVSTQIDAPIKKPITYLEEAPYTPSFWENYNRIVE